MKVIFTEPQEDSINIANIDLDNHYIVGKNGRSKFFIVGNGYGNGNYNVLSENGYNRGNGWGTYVSAAEVKDFMARADVVYAFYTSEEAFKWLAEERGEWVTQ